MKNKKSYHICQIAKLFVGALILQISFLKMAVKAQASKKVLAYYDIDINEAMAFGDGGNDVEMLEAVNMA